MNMKRSTTNEPFGVQDLLFMQRALDLAAAAATMGEVPVGAVVVCRDQVVGEGANSCVRNFDPTAHAEILALKAASSAVGNYRIPEAELFVTLEPCTMCAGAMVHARIKRLIFAATDSRTGAICSCCKTLDAEYHNHSVAWSHGLLADESSNLLKTFFRERR